MTDENKKPACSEKLSFDMQKQAVAAAVVAKYQHGIRLKSYVCKHCGLWHLASDYEN